MVLKKLSGSIKKELRGQSLAQLTIFTHMISYEYHVMINAGDGFVSIFFWGETCVHIFEEVPVCLEPYIVVGLHVIIPSLQH